MRKFYDFRHGLDKEDWFDCYSPHALAKGKFVQEKDCIRNEYNESIGDYDYTTAMHKDIHGVGVKVVAECDFDGSGAPIITFTDDLKTRSDGDATYGVHFEVVAFEKGCNFWYYLPPMEGQDPLSNLSLLRFEDYPLSSGEKIRLSVEFQDQSVVVGLNDHTFEVFCEHFPRSFYLGFTACEGINRFYNIEIEEN